MFGIFGIYSHWHVKSLKLKKNENDELEKNSEIWMSISMKMEMK